MEQGDERYGVPEAAETYDDSWRMCAAQSTNRLTDGPFRTGAAIDTKKSRMGSAPCGSWVCADP